MNTQPAFDFLDHPRPLAFAHRGGAADGMENSMAAFQRAIDLGYRYIETDVRATVDGVLLAFHDETLDRMAGRSGRVCELPYAEVARARLGNGAAIPLVEDVLGTWPDVRLNIDVKDVSTIAPLVRTLRRTNAADRVCVASFSERRLAAARAVLGPRVCTSLSPRAALRLRMAAYGRLLERLSPTDVPCAQLPPHVGKYPLVTGDLVDAAHDRGMQVHVWTVNDPGEMGRLLDLGVDGLITDRLETLRDVCAVRGCWPGR